MRYLLYTATFLIIICAFLYTESPGKVNYGYITAPSGLTLRSKPSTGAGGRVITVIPFDAKVALLGTGKKKPQ